MLPKAGGVVAALLREEFEIAHELQAMAHEGIPVSWKALAPLVPAREAPTLLRLGPEPRAAPPRNPLSRQELLDLVDLFESGLPVSWPAGWTPRAARGALLDHG